MLWQGRPLLSMASTQHHLAIYPFSSAVIDTVREDLDGYSISRGTIRFTSDHPIPDELLERIIRARMEQITGATS
ncbi:MAG: hypothetical protein JJE50_10565 [Actinomycetales bacterium]|nr:hypothetical protein [Actinomycetales bacterium]